MSRFIAKITIEVWDEGLPPDRMADHVQHVAAMIRKGFHCGDVVDEDIRGGWWSTDEPKGSSPPATEGQS